MKRRISRLGSKLVGVSVLGLALAFTLFWLTENTLLPWLLYSDRFAAFWQRQDEARFQACQDYVTARGLTVQEALEDQSGELDRLAAGIYTVLAAPSAAAVLPADDANASYVLTWSGRTGTEKELYSDVELVMELHQIQCADGMIYVSAAPAALRYEGLGRIGGLLLALLGFCLVVVPYIVRLLRRLEDLSHEAEVLMAGDLEHSIRTPGRDELSQLGENMERLRRSVLERIRGEREAVEAGNRLIAGLSHDLRTPLTKLTGCLDILLYRRYRTQEEHDAFVRMAAEKAAQLKLLTDQLFASARTDAPGAPLEQEPADGPALLGQLLEEGCGDLRREGFEAEPPVFRQPFRVNLAAADAVRIFDNLFSNLRKYADPAVPVGMEIEESAEAVTLRVRDCPRRTPDRGDSHGVGVPTMRDLLERSGGRLEITLTDGCYESALTFLKIP